MSRTENRKNLPPLGKMLKPAAFILALLLAPLAPGAEAVDCGTPPLADPPCYGIGPGALMHALDWTACSTSFLVRNESSVFIWTAGHCTRQVGQPVWFFYPEPGVTERPAEMEKRPPDGVVVYRPYEEETLDVPPPVDYSLIEVNRSVWKWLRPEMPVWPGPSNIFTDWDSEPALIHLYGHFFGTEGTPAEARTGIGPISVYEQTFTFHMPAEKGDSGGPIVSESGEAIGFITWGDRFGPSRGDGIAIGTRLDYAMNRAHKDLGLNLTLIRSLEDIPSSNEPPHQEPVEGDRIDKNKDAGISWTALVLIAVLAAATRRKC